MKIVFIISSLGSGGAERVLTLLANHFVSKHEVFVITLSQNKPFYFIDNRVNLIQLNLIYNSNSVFSGIENNVKRISLIRKAIYNINPDIIISFLTQTNIISLLANFGKFPIIIAERSIYNSETNSKFWRLLRRFIYPFADILVLLTKEDAKNYYFVDNKVVIPNFIKVSNNSIKSLLKKKEDIVLAVGRLHPVKQFDKLIYLFSKIDTNYKLYIVGEGSERERLETLIKKLNLQNKVFLPGRTKNIDSYYKKAKIFVLTSKYEAFPNVLLESMNYGCIPISFDCDYGPRNIIENNKSGFLVKSDEEFILKVKEVMDSDRNKFIEMMQNSINRIKDFDENKVLKKWEDLIENVKNKKNCI